MRKPKTLQSILDPFVLSVGGQVVSTLIDSRNPQSNADYYFPKHNVIAEHKSLQAGGFASSFHRKLSELIVKWQRQGKLIVYGTVQIESSKLRPDCREEMFNAMAESMQKHLVVAANKQLRSTKELLARPQAHGLLWVASDGNDDFQPDAIWYILNRILQKKTFDGQLAYSSIDAIAYFNPRMPAVKLTDPNPALFWFSRTRRPDPSMALRDCISFLADEWPKYVTGSQGIPVRAVTGTPSDLSFPGGPKVPKIIPDYAKQ